MTMIAIACKGDHAEIITDSMAYNNMCSQLKPSTKVVVLTHLDTAVATQGDSGFGSLIQATMLTSTTDSATCFDELVKQTPDNLRFLWGKRAEAEDMTGLEGTVLLIGPSGRTGQFEAVAFAHDTNFDPQPITGLFAMPSPLAHRPHDLELTRLRADAALYGDEDVANVVEEWAARSVGDVPAELEDWAELALRCRDRGLISFASVLVMGSVHYLRIREGGHQSAVLLDFNDDGPELEKLMEGTNHPAALGAPCHCDSGKRLIDCHLAEGLDHPCDCDLGTKTGKFMRECCAASLLVEQENADLAAQTPADV